MVRCRGTWWREVRPCFYRPLLPFIDAPSGSAGLPGRAAFGGCQYGAFAGGEPPNSSLAYIVFADAQSYRLERLRHGRRWEVRSGEKRFAIKLLSDKDEFKARAYPIYLEHYRRTKYGYREDRIRRSQFERWVDAEFVDPGIVPLGAWTADSLQAVSLSRVVGEAWLYSSFFAADAALRGHVASLMLHHVRCLAAAVDGVTIVFAGMQKTGTAGASVDAFYLHRGAEVVRRPAVLEVNRLAEWTLSRLRPRLWARLLGDLSAGSEVGHTAQDA